VLISPVDQLLLLAEGRSADDDRAFALAMLLAHDVASDLIAQRGQKVTWGLKYLEETRAEALAAIREFPGIDAYDGKAVLACQQKVRDYLRVAGFIDRTLRETVQAVTEPEDGEPSDEMGLGAYHSENSDAGNGDADA
jgi:hypothetical protein